MLTYQHDGTAEQILLDFDGVFFHSLICWWGFGTHWVSNNSVHPSTVLTAPLLAAVTLLWLWAAAFDPALQQSENVTLIEKSCTTWGWSHKGFIAWLQSLIEIWLKTEINHYFAFWSDLPDFTTWMCSHICRLWPYETEWTLWVLLSCLCYTLWGFLWRSFISNIEWWCSVLTKASAAVVWHAFPLELPRLESVGGNLSGCWRPWWKPWIVVARKISEWEELPDLSGIRPCLMFSKPVGVSMDSCQV